MFRRVLEYLGLVIPVPRIPKVGKEAKKGLVFFLNEYIMRNSNKLFKRNRISGNIEAVGTKNAFTRNCLLTLVKYMKDKDITDGVSVLTEMYTGREVAKTVVEGENGREFKVGSMPNDVIPLFFTAYMLGNAVELNDLLALTDGRVMNETHGGTQAIITTMKSLNLRYRNELKIRHDIIWQNHKNNVMAMYILQDYYKDNKELNKKYLKTLKNELIRNTEYDLFPAILGYKAGLLDKQKLISFLFNHTFNMNKMDNFNFILPLLFIKDELDDILLNA